MELDREREHWHNITVIATQRGQRSLYVHHLRDTETLLELVHLVCFFHCELKRLNETSILPPAPTDEYEALRGLKQCKLYIVCYLKSTVSTV